MKNSLSYALFSENQWIFTDTALAEGQPTLTLEAARGGHTLCQLLTDLTVEEGTPISYTVGGSTGIGMSICQLLPVFVKKNSAPRGKMNTTDDYEAVKHFVTHKAPFHVYDALYPLKQPKVKAGRLAFSLQFAVGAEAPLGEQEMTLSITVGEQSLSLTLPLTVHAFTLPTQSELMVCNWLYPVHLAKEYGVAVYSEEFWPIYREYLTHQLAIRSNQLCLVNLKNEWGCVYPIRDESGRIVDFDLSGYERALQIGREMGFTKLYGCFVAYWPKWDSPDLYLLWDWENKIHVESEEGFRQLKLYFKRVREMIARNGWEDCYMQTLADEPQVHNAKAYRILCAIAHQQLPGVLINDPIETTEILGGPDIWCVKQTVYERDYEIFRRYQEMGERMTYYTCGYPAGDSMNRVLDLPLSVGRLTFWMCERYGFEGFLHWGYHRGNDIAFTHIDAACSQPAGNQSIVYVVDGVFCESLRSQNQLFGVEDYEAIAALAKADPARAHALVERCCRTFEDYETDPKAIEATRHELLTLASAL